MARTLLMGGYKDMVELSDRVRMAEIAMPEEWSGKTLRQLDLRGRHQLKVLAVRDRGELVLNWGPDKPLSQGSTLLVIADRREFDRLEL